MKPLLAGAAMLSLALAAGMTPARADSGTVIGLAATGRMVSDLDRSVAFYKTLGFQLDAKGASGWHKDPLVERLHGVNVVGRNIETRAATMFVVNADSKQRFTLQLRELRGLPQRNLSQHEAWEPGSSHFGFAVADPEGLWTKLQAQDLLRARSWGGRLAAPPGREQGLVAYITDPDGLDIEIIRATPEGDAASGQNVYLPGVNHLGLVVLDSDKARQFYGDLLGGKLLTSEAPWMSGDFTDAAVGGHGNILRFYNLMFPMQTGQQTDATSGSRFEMVEFQNRKRPVRPMEISDVGVGYIIAEVDGLDTMLERAWEAGASMVSDGIVTMADGSRAAIIRDPDVGGFVKLIEPAKPRAEVSALPGR